MSDGDERKALAQPTLLGYGRRRRCGTRQARRERKRRLAYLVTAICGAEPSPAQAAQRLAEALAPDRVDYLSPRLCPQRSPASSGHLPNPEDNAGRSAIADRPAFNLMKHYGRPMKLSTLPDRPKTFGRTTIAAGTSGGLTADQKRGSKFTLSDKATLLRLSAYLDGLGATTGSQDARMALYRDSNGVPTDRLAQSTIVTISAGTTGRWVNFVTPAVPLDPGQYWIILHTGATQGVARYYADDIAANRYGNLDPFTDGATNPFGAGTAGGLTLSVNATYTVGY